MHHSLHIQEDPRDPRSMALAACLRLVPNNMILLWPEDVSRVVKRMNDIVDGAIVGAPAIEEGY